MILKLLFLSFNIFANQIVVTETGADVQIPALLWEKIDEKRGEATLEFMPIEVEIEEKNSGVLRETEFKFKFPKGGGTLDLAPYTTERQGTFFLKIEVPDSMAGDDLRVYFLSNARKRRLEKDVWGAGCNQAMDITSFFKKTAKEEGLELNTHRFRHLTVAGGHFIFTHKNQISRLTVTDSSQPDYFCQAQKKSSESQTK